MQQKSKINSFQLTKIPQQKGWQTRKDPQQNIDSKFFSTISIPKTLKQPKQFLQNQLVQPIVQPLQQYTQLSFRQHAFQSRQRQRQRSSKNQFNKRKINKSKEMENHRKVDEYWGYLTYEEIQAVQTKRLLQKHIGRFMPKNGSFSQAYAERKVMDEKQAKIEQTQLNQDKNKNTKLFQKSDHLDHHLSNQQSARKNKSLIKKSLLAEILRNKRIDFGKKVKQNIQKLRPQSKQIHRRTISHQQIKHGNQIKIIKSGQQKLLPKFFIPNKSRTKSSIQMLASPFSMRSSSSFSSPKNLFFVPSPKSPFLNPCFPSHTSIPFPTQISSTLSTIQTISQKVTQKSQKLIFKTKEKQKEFEKVYQELSQQTSQVINGYTTLRLEEENSQKYMSELKDMWMNNDLRRIRK